eukprot:CAMPEP_0194213848 /NCGR_PEP_ID=MMETSP0156-20130528/14718_1 /TAXON_ID=33649 /ORGANISM="Thalassionema nitzschioides, Strain L26-B" /LENGTH=190 /DNA_ID=CAMNT_0038941977 /DNA_START=110 /DNA_END=682 /DNA_ORIENTATION=+
MSDISLAVEGADDDEDDEEWEYVEFESITEADLLGSEWLVGTCYDKKPDKIDETWCRLARTEKNENIAVWGDNSEGKWSLDVASQYITISKNYVWGKQIWSCVVEDYYYLAGTVRSWSYLTAAAVEAQWQAKRLGADKEEAGIAPWFDEESELYATTEDEANSEEVESETASLPAADANPVTENASSLQE